MKTRILCLLGLPLLAGLASFTVTTGQIRQIWIRTIKSDPLIEYPARLDLGAHEMGDLATAHFTIANRGGGELVIDDIHTNCSCTGMEREQDGLYEHIESLHLRAGEQADLVMRVSVRGVPIGAEMINTVDFRTNDPTQPAGRIEAVVRSVSGGVSANPGLIAFGTVPMGTKIREIVDVYDHALAPRTIGRVISSQPELVIARLLPDIESSAPPRSMPERVLIGRIEITVNTATAGEINESVQIHLAGETRNPDAIKVFGKIAAPIEMSPSFLALPRASSKGPIYEGTCVCRSTLGKPLEVTVTSAPSGVKVEVLDEGKSTRRIRIQWDPKASKGDAISQRKPIRLQAKAGEHKAFPEVQLFFQ